MQLQQSQINFCSDRFNPISNHAGFHILRFFQSRSLSTYPVRHHDCPLSLECSRGLLPRFEVIFTYFLVFHRATIISYSFATYFPGLPLLVRSVKSGNTQHTDQRSCHPSKTLLKAAEGIISQKRC